MAHQVKTNKRKTLLKIHGEEIHKLSWIQVIVISDI